jgi:hypothetical protein
MTPHLRTSLGLSLIAIHVALPLAAFACARWQPRDWSTRNLFLLVVFGQAGLLCVWAALSARRVTWEAAACAAGLVVCWSLLKIVDAKQTSRLLIECLLFPGAATFGLTLAIKSSLVREAPDSGWQFSVGQLLIFTTAIAVGITLVQHFSDARMFVNSRLVMAEGAQIGVILMTWAVLPRRRRAMRLTLAVLLVCAVGITVQSFMSDSFFWDALKTLNRISAFTLWEDLLSIPLAILLESLLAAATVAFFYHAPANPVLDLEQV